VLSASQAIHVYGPRTSPTGGRGRCSMARGLMQFTDATWPEMVRDGEHRHGRERQARLSETRGPKVASGSAGKRHPAYPLSHRLSSFTAPSRASSIGDDPAKTMVRTHPVRAFLLRSRFSPSAQQIQHGSEQAFGSIKSDMYQSTSARCSETSIYKSWAARARSVAGLGLVSADALSRIETIGSAQEPTSVPTGTGIAKQEFTPRVA
jgi:hypothetical protein